MGVSEPSVPIVYCETLPPLFATYTYLPEGSMATDWGFVPAPTAAVDMGPSEPSAPIVYCETVLLALFATYTCLPEGSTATDWGFPPAAAFPRYLSRPDETSAA